ncbi:MAG: 16S rRNA (guanine(966)-N(2))-methyltransferase RsmD [Syntrophorhabdaceae bacterium]|nr:16S rRNA (guanine(966)-N(2))-methyltransferase RsmD [Syntrophorhabdaceae bacterium]
MRIVAGKWRGRKLRAPRGLDVRPTTDRVREAIFSIIGERVAGAKVLDLFAGTGAMAIEALSRGAAGAVLVESSLAAMGVLRENLASVDASSAVCLPLDYRKALRRFAVEGCVFSLVFLDPPYGRGLAGEAASMLGAAKILAPGAIVVVESDRRDHMETTPAEWTLESERRYGDTTVLFYEAGPDK